MQRLIDEDYEADVKQGIANRNATFMMIQPELPEKRQKVYNIILSKGKKGVTRKEIASALGWPINCVTGRVTELRDKHNLIVEPDSRLTPCYDGRVYPNGVLIAKCYL